MNVRSRRGMRARLALVVLGLNGCAAVQPTPEFDSVEQALLAARSEVGQGRWGQARRVLESAEQQAPEDARLPALRERLARSWEMRRQHLEDELLTVRVQAAQDEIALLEPLLLAEPDRPWQSLRLQQRRAVLPKRRPELMACARRQLESDLVLARRCVLLARRIEPGVDAMDLIGDIDARLAARYAAREARVEARAERRLRSRIESSLEQVEADLAADDFQQATDRLSGILAADPDNAQARRLQAELAETTARRSGVLNELAARLYLEGQIESAIRVWEASLEVAPAQPQIRERLERARRVRARLDELRKEDPATSDPPTSVPAPDGGAAPDKPPA